MNYLKPAVIFALFLVSLASTTLAWRQYQELIALRAASSGAGGPADSAARIRELEQLTGQLRDELLAQASAGDTVPGEPPTERPADRSIAWPARGSRGGADRAIRKQAGNLQVQALRTAQQKAQLDQRYADLFRQLNLSPEKLEEFKTLLAERQATAMDVMSAAREQGIDPHRSPDSFRQLMAAAQGSVEQEIKSLMGDAAYADYRAYERTAAQRNTVSQLERRLSYTDSPLTATQAAELVQILASTSPTATTDLPAPMMGGHGGRGSGEGPRAAITLEAVAQAAAVLSPMQVGALQQLQQQQEAQLQLRQLVGGGSGRGSRGAGG